MAVEVTQLANDRHKGDGHQQIDHADPVQCRGADRKILTDPGEQRREPALQESGTEFHDNKEADGAAGCLRLCAAVEGGGLHAHPFYGWVTCDGIVLSKYRWRPLRTLACTIKKKNGVHVQDVTLNLLDLRIINALQIAPRAPWAQLAPIIGADAATLNRRWRELHATGAAWISTFDEGSWQAGALVEINCNSGANLDVASALAETPEAIGVDLTAGGRDIVATIAAPSEAALWTYLLEVVPRISGIESTRSHPIARNVFDASAWRVRALDQEETRRVQALASPGKGRPTIRNAGLERRIIGALNQDGRATATTIGGMLGETPRHIRETMTLMIASGRLHQRTDLVRGASGWPVSAWYFLRVPASKLDGVAARLQHLDELRLVSHTVGPYDLIMGVWLKSLAEVQRLEQHLEIKLTGVSTADRSVVLRSIKQLGQILDERGHATGRNNLHAV